MQERKSRSKDTSARVRPGRDASGTVVSRQGKR